MGVSFTDFDLHGIVGLRLENAHHSDVAAVRRQLGPIRRPLARDPDITIRFEDRLAPSQTLRLIGLDDVAFTDDAFLVLRGQHKSMVRVQIPFDNIGGSHLLLVAERGLSAVPHLLALLNLTMVARGVLPLHASAFEYRGIGALATGWSKGGKTETLLAFAAHGARYIGDEWVYLAPDSGLMYGVPEPIRLWKWQLDQMPRYRSTVPRSDRFRLAVLQLLTGGIARLCRSTSTGRTSACRFLRRADSILSRQLCVQVPPQRLFPQDSPVSEAVLQRVLLVSSHDAPDFVVEPIAPSDIADRMLFSLAEERAELWSCYRKFLFAFPERRNPFLDSVEERERGLLYSALARAEACAVRHPYPFAIAELFESLRSLFEQRPQEIQS